MKVGTTDPSISSWATGLPLLFPHPPVQPLGLSSEPVPSPSFCGEKAGLRATVYCALLGDMGSGFSTWPFLKTLWVKTPLEPSPICLGCSVYLHPSGIYTMSPQLYSKLHTFFFSPCRHWSYLTNEPGSSLKASTGPSTMLAHRQIQQNPRGLRHSNATYDL